MLNDQDIEIIHIEDEIRTHSSVWTKMRSRVLASLSIEDRKTLVVSTVLEKISSETQSIEVRIRNYKWQRGGKNFKIRVSSFFSHVFAEQYFEGKISESGCIFVKKDDLPLFVLDTRNHEKMDVLSENIEVVKPFLSPTAGNFRVFSAYYDKLIKDAALKQKMVSQREDVSDALISRLKVPEEWNLPEHRKMLLCDYLISKVKTDDLLDFIFQEMVQREIVVAD